MTFKLDLPSIRRVHTTPESTDSLQCMLDLPSIRRVHTTKNVPSLFLSTVGSTLYSKGTHNFYFFSGLLREGWIYPLFEGYTQPQPLVGYHSIRWIYPLFEGYTQHDS